MKIFMGKMNVDASPLEYKGEYRCARGQLKLSDLINNPSIVSQLSRNGLSFSEEPLDFLFSDSTVFANDVSNTFLVSTDSI